MYLSDRAEYSELANQRGDTYAWYLKPAGGVDASSREAFELLRFAVNGAYATNLGWRGRTFVTR